MLDPFVHYVTERVREFPDLSVESPLRETRAMGYIGTGTALGDLVREVRPPRQRDFKVRFEMPAGHQPQVDFARFNVELRDALEVFGDSVVAAARCNLPSSLNLAPAEPVQRRPARPRRSETNPVLARSTRMIGKQLLV